eukprot:5194684-Pleurochrysis_carterae.AAC.1
MVQGHALLRTRIFQSERHTNTKLKHLARTSGPRSRGVLVGEEEGEEDEEHDLDWLDDEPRVGACDDPARDHGLRLLAPELGAVRVDEGERDSDNGEVEGPRRGEAAAVRARRAALESRFQPERLARHELTLVVHAVFGGVRARAGTAAEAEEAAEREPRAARALCEAERVLAPAVAPAEDAPADKDADEADGGGDERGGDDGGERDGPALVWAAEQESEREELERERVPEELDNLRVGQSLLVVLRRSGEVDNRVLALKSVPHAQREARRLLLRLRAEALLLTLRAHDQTRQLVASERASAACARTVARRF